MEKINSLTFNPLLSDQNSFG